MTKLEEKLIELGYKDYGIPSYHYNIHLFKKIYKYPIEIRIYPAENKQRVMNYVIHIDDSYSFNEQKFIDNIQQAFNQLQQDLEVLREYAKM